MLNYPWIKKKYKDLCPYGGQSGAAATRPHSNHQDVGSNPATARNKKTDIGQTPAQMVPQ